VSSTLNSTFRPTSENRPYCPSGSAFELFTSRNKEFVLSGPAGTGKSRACLEYLHACAVKYPGMRGLILRKTRTSLTETGLVTFEEKVVPAGSPVVSGPQRAFRKVYRYPNGSELIVGGLDNATKVMSSEYDIAYVQEAIELVEDDWEKVTTRLRNGVMPYQRLIGDTNPDAPTHWLRQRSNAGRLRMLDSKHEENPVYWDARAGQWTALGASYIATLDALTGVRKERLRFGRWVAAEGTVYEFDRAVHVIDRFEIPREWPRIWCCDFGFTNPLVLAAFAVDPDGRLYRYRELYQTQTLVEDAARLWLAATKDEPRPKVIVCDHDAEDRATLERHLGLRTLPAYKGVSPGIQAVATRLRVAADGRARLFFLRDSLIRRDPALDEKKKPACTEEEFDSYVWDLSNNRKKGEEPLKENDHGCDMLRYGVCWLDKVEKRPQKAAGF
jgi:phage terminase large subunit